MFIPDNTYRTMLETLPILCVDAVIVHDDKCLLLLRNNEPAKDTYWFPGGRVYKNEALRDAALRKAKEETNLDCTFVKIISVEESMFKRNVGMATDVHTVNVCCLLNLANKAQLKLDHLHNGFTWATTISKSYHSAVVNPLLLLGFRY